MKKTIYLLLIITFTINVKMIAQNNDNIIDEVIWVIGDEAILRSDIEAIIEDARLRRVSLPENPFCTLPEQIAIEKLFLHQASIDSIKGNKDFVNERVERDIKNYILRVGSKKRAEELMKKPISKLREELLTRYTQQQLVQLMQQKLVEGIEATPAEINHFYKSKSPDSFPAIPEQLEVQILSIKPPIPQSEKERIKSKLRSYIARAQKDPNEFALLARLYSEDKGSALKGGELGFAGRGKYDPNFADVAYALQRPNQISRVVESLYGFHIIQLLERRGDQSNFRHILLRPKTTEEVKIKGLTRLDSIANLIRMQKLSFENSVLRFSEDKDTKLNNGLMMREDAYTQSYTSHFKYEDLPPEVAAKAYSMKVGEISNAFTMINTKTGYQMLAIIKLKSKTPTHKANPKNDYQLIKTLLEEKKKSDFLDKWILKKQKETYINIDPKYRDCNFKHKNWLKK